MGLSPEKEARMRRNREAAFARRQACEAKRLNFGGGAPETAGSPAPIPLATRIGPMEEPTLCTPPLVEAQVQEGPRSGTWRSPPVPNWPSPYAKEEPAEDGGPAVKRQRCDVEVKPESRDDFGAPGGAESSLLGRSRQNANSRDEPATPSPPRAFPLESHLRPSETAHEHKPGVLFSCSRRIVVDAHGRILEDSAAKEEHRSQPDPTVADAQIGDAMNRMKQEGATFNPPMTSAGPSSEQPWNQHNRHNFNAPHVEPDPPLSIEQQSVVDALEKGKNVFVTGCAGTGKSFLLRTAVRKLREMHGQEHVHVTASTGLAACALGGVTLHSFAGVGIGEADALFLFWKILKMEDVKRRWEDARALVIDEISMVDSVLMLLVTGDFLQLPPVSKGQHDKCFAFQSQCWRSCFHVSIELTRVFRQEDAAFVRLLGDVRKGKVTDETRHILEGRIRSAPRKKRGGIVATKLYPHKKDVEAENLGQLRGLPDPEHFYLAKDEAYAQEGFEMLEHVRAARGLPLKVGAQVMLLRNLDTKNALVNGSRGVVTGFISTEDASVEKYTPCAEDVGVCGFWPLVRFAGSDTSIPMGPKKWSVERHGQEVAWRVQVPLALAWAASVHKCQGMTLDLVQAELSRAFDFGMVYVALSRARTLNGLFLTGLDFKKIMAHPRVMRFYDCLREDAKSPPLKAEESDHGGNSKEEPVH